jgi:hypothetical protein
VPMCVEAAMISLTRRAHCSALSSVSSNVNPAIGGSGFSSRCSPGQVRKEIKSTQASHPEVREHRQLAQLGRQPFELIIANLEHRLGSDHDPTKSSSSLRGP